MFISFSFSFKGLFSSSSSSGIFRLELTTLSANGWDSMTLSDLLFEILWDSLRFFEILWDSLRFSPRATEGIFPRFFLDSLRSVGDARDSSKVFKDPISRLHSLQHLRQSISLESTRRKGFFLPRREMFTRLIACKQHRCCFFKK